MALSQNPQQALILLLQRAHAGELAAARAYQGHAASWWARRERAEISQIEADEWHHRRQVAEMLIELKSQPVPWREALLWSIGTIIGLLCHIGGWLIPMYGAGKLERDNYHEYQTAIELALQAKLPHMAQALLQMSETEWDHEQWFRQQVLKHPLGRFMPLWKTLPARHHLREQYQELVQK